MLRREKPLLNNNEATQTGEPPILAQFETKCLVSCGTSVNINGDNNQNRTLAVWKMQADTQGDAVLTFSISFGAARVRVYDMPEGTAQGINGVNVLFDSVDALPRGTYSGTDNPDFVFTTDKLYLFVDFLEKEEDTAATVQINCYTNTSAATNPSPYYSECVNDVIVLEQSESYDLRVLDNDIRNDRFIYNTLRVGTVGSGSAVAKPNGLITVTAPAWVGVPSVYTVEYKIKDFQGIEHCGEIEVTTQNTAITIGETPAANDDEAEVNELESVIIPVLANDIDNTFVLSSLRVKTLPSIGGAVVNLDGTITYTAPEVGADTVTTFIYSINDFTGAEYSATVTVNIKNTLPPAQLRNDFTSIAAPFTLNTRPTANDTLTDLDLTSIRVKAGQVFSHINNVFFDGEILKLTGISVGVDNIIYEIDDNAGTTTYEASVRVDVYAVQPINPPNNEPDIILLDDGLRAINAGTTVNFGQFNIGQNVYKLIRVKNKGAQTLTVSSTTVTGDFESGGFVGSLSAGSNFIFQIVMDTATAGVKTGVLTVNSNDPDTPAYVVNLNGGIAQVLAPKLEIYDLNTYKAPNSSKDFGSNAQGETIIKDLELRNLGNSSLTVTSANSSADFTSTFNGVIPAGGRQTVSITLDTATGGTKTGIFTVVSDDPSVASYAINLNAEVLETVVSVPNILLIEVETGAVKYPYQVVNFNTQDISATATKDIRIKNNGSATLNISSITDPANFASSGFVSGAITAGNTQDFTITFDTSTVGSFNEVIAVNSDDPDTAIYYLTLTGIVADQTPNLTILNASNNDLEKATGSTALFNTVEQNENSAQVFKLLNIGGGALNVSSVTVTGDFTKSSTFNSGIIAAGGNYQVAGVVMDTTTTGSKSGVLTVNSNDPDTPAYIVNLSGNVIVLDPNIVLVNTNTNEEIQNGGALSYGTTDTGNRLERFIGIRNKGNDSLTVSSISISADFTALAFSATIAAGAMELLKVTLDDTTAGSKAGVLTVNSNDPDTPAYTLNLSAEVVEPAAPQMVIRDFFNNEIYNNDTLNLGDVELGGYNDANTGEILFISNVGTTDLNITGFSISEPYFETNGTATTRPADNKVYPITVLGTLNIDQLTGTLEIYSNDPTNPTFTINLVKGVNYTFDGTETI